MPYDDNTTVQQSLTCIQVLRLSDSKIIQTEVKNEFELQIHVPKIFLFPQKLNIFI